MNSPLIGLVVVVVEAVVVFVKMKAVATETKMRSLVMMESYQAIKLSNSKRRTKTTCYTIVDNTNYVELLSYFLDRSFVYRGERQEQLCKDMSTNNYRSDFNNRSSLN